jgi:nitroimidazol reductase NimA-like FMN-containing flavoprotein (pyridoxamine 5'-phosphate oxidase superfamily)
MKTLAWKEFATVAPDLAAFAERRLKGRVAYLATLRADGSPRVHPVTPHVGEGRLFIYMEPSSPKVLDLRRDGRFALHCTVEDTSGGEGEVVVRGHASIIEDPATRATLFDIARGEGFHPEERYVVFEFCIAAVSSTTYEDDRPVRRSWKTS